MLDLKIVVFLQVNKLGQQRFSQTNMKKKLILLNCKNVAYNEMFFDKYFTEEKNGFSGVLHSVVKHVKYIMFVVP